MPRSASLPSITPAMMPPHSPKASRGQKSWPIGRPSASAVRGCLTPAPLLCCGRIEGDDSMRRFDPVCVAAAAAVLVGLGCAPAVAENGQVELAAHRAIYDLKLAETRGRRQLSGVQGRIVYDFSGSACEGYALQFRQVTELDNGEGKVVVSDLRSATWEEGAAKDYRFNFQNYL